MDKGLRAPRVGMIPVLSRAIVCDESQSCSRGRQPLLADLASTKFGQPRHVPLSDGTLVLLRAQQLRCGESTWLFPNPATGQPFRSVFYAWDAARRQARLADLRMHDLRHSFASFLINSGRSLYEVQQLLGHRSSQMTQRYAHLAHETLLAARTARRR